MVREWSFGDRVVHAKRPEWGSGVVTAAQQIVHEGTPCQRVTIRFDRAGVKTLSTALAELMAAAEAPAIAAPHTAENGAGNSGPGAPGAGDKGWLNRLADKSPDEVMGRLPEAATDPFTSLDARLRATLHLYRFTDQGGSLLDWAAAQSGLKDPLSEFSRHDLERLFQRFAFNRDEHLKKLALEMRKKDPESLKVVLRSAPTTASQALRRLDIGR